MKRKTLLLAIAMIVCAFGNLYAQKGVTSQYIKNATLSNGTTGWTNVNFNTPVKGNNTVGYASECYAGWSDLEKDNYSLTQTITLPAGHYTLVSYSFFRYGLNADTDPSKSLAFLKAGDQKVAIKTLGSITASGYANSQAEGANAFDSKMYRNTLDFTIAADNTPIEIGLEGTFDLKQSWVIAGMFELIDNDQEATMDSPFDVTGYITNSGFEYRDMSGWTVAPEGFFNTQSNNQGFKVGGYYAEKWQASGALPGGTMTQTIKDLPAGYYQLTANIGGNGTFIDLNGKTASWTADGNYTVGYVLSAGEDLTITAGKTEEGTANWVHFDNFKLSFCGDLAKALTDLCAKVTEYEGKIPADAYSQLLADVNSYNHNYSDAAELLAAVDAISVLYEKADALAALVDSFNTAMQRAKTAAATTDKIWEQLREDLKSVIGAFEPMSEQTPEAYTAAIEALNGAAAAVENSAASYKIIASGTVPTDNVAGWTCTNSEPFHVNDWSVEGNTDGTGMVIPFIENWVNNSSVLGDGMVYYTLEGLTPGEVYFAQALVRVYSESGNVPNGPIFFINDVETDMTAAGTSFSFTNQNGAVLQGYYGTLGGTATVGEDGKLILGVRISGANYNWVAFKDVHIQSMDDALQTAINKVEAFYGKVTAAAESDAKNLVESIKNARLTTSEDYENAIKLLNEKADALAPVAAAYQEAISVGNVESVYFDDVKALADVASYKELTAGAHAKLVKALDNFAMPTPDNEALQRLTTAEEINAFISNYLQQAKEADNAIRAAGIEYNNNAEPTGDAQFNLTFMLTNPNLEGHPTWASCVGWYTDQPVGAGNSQVMTNPDATSEDGTKTAFYEYWSEAPAADDNFTLYQKVTLPAGIYNMSCYAFAQQPVGGDVRGVKFYANDTEGSTIATDRLAPASIEFVNTTSGEVKVGLKGCAGNTYRWMGIGYVELYRLSSTKETRLSDDDAAAPAAGAYTSVIYDRKFLKGYNTIVLPFATSKTELAVDKVLQYTGTEEVNGKVRLHFKESETLNANTPYVIFVTNDRPLPNFENKTITEPTNLTVADANYSFVGSYKAYAAGASPLVDGDYFVGVEGFKKSSGGNEHKAYRAYLKKEMAGGPIDEPVFCINGAVVDGISEVNAATRQSGQVYNLNGQKVNRAQKGVYIIDGRKVVVK